MLCSKDERYKTATAISQTTESALLPQNIGWEQAVAVLTVALSLEVAVAHSEN